jgi:hypothetical protein
MAITSLVRGVRAGLLPKTEYEPVIKVSVIHNPLHAVAVAIAKVISCTQASLSWLITRLFVALPFAVQS